MEQSTVTRKLVILGSYCVVLHFLHRSTLWYSKKPTVALLTSRLSSVNFLLFSLKIKAKVARIWALLPKSCRNCLISGLKSSYSLTRSSRGIFICFQLPWTLALLPDSSSLPVILELQRLAHIFWNVWLTVAAK